MARKPSRRRGLLGEPAQDETPAPKLPERLTEEEAHRLEEALLERIEQGAKMCREIEEKLRAYPAPDLETLIKLHRMLVLKLSADAQATPALLGLVSALMKPVMDWAWIEEKRRDREFAAAKLASKEKLQDQRVPALRPETLEKIERELHLL